MKRKYDIFISYRREGGYDTAKHLYDLLVRDGYRVSFDIDTLRSGDFDTQLLIRIEQCTDFILIVDKHTFDRTLNPSFDPKKDWVRCELAYALKNNKNVIPVFLSGINSFPDGLPEDIAGVSMKNGPEYNCYHFNAFYQTLKKRFLRSNNRNLFKYALGLIILLVIGMILLFGNRENNNRNSDSIETSIDEVSKIDSTKYYWGTFNEKSLFVKGLKRGSYFDYSCESGHLYTYKCGVCFDISVGYISQINEDIIFYATDEDDITVPLDTYFGDIGYDPTTYYDGYYDIYRDNQYLVGQYDIDDDKKDELIIAVRTAGDDLSKEGCGIGINIFKLENRKWKRIASLNKITNILPANAKFIKNSIYIHWLRLDEKYSFTEDSLYYDSDFYGRAFTESDFEE